MEHYFTEKTEVSLHLGLVSAMIRKQMFEFYSSPPLFSWRQIDKGTIVLANGMQLADCGKMLDLGCGYGVIGIAAAVCFPDLKVTMTDATERAVYLTEMNVKKYELTNRVEVKKGYLYGPVEVSGAEQHGVLMKKFDAIISNPPYSAGKEVVKTIIERAPSHLNSGGTLQIVGRHTKGGRMYKEIMQSVFKEVEETGKSGGFRVYIGRI